LRFIQYIKTHHAIGVFRAAPSQDQQLLSRTMVQSKPGSSHESHQQTKAELPDVNDFPRDTRFWLILIALSCTMFLTSFEAVRPLFVVDIPYSFIIYRRWYPLLCLSSPMTCKVPRSYGLALRICWPPLRAFPSAVVLLMYVAS
jgi:hypothetical protein